MNTSKTTTPKKGPLVTYTATDIITNEIIAEGYDIEIVVKKADASDKEYMINFITNPNYTFIF